MLTYIREHINDWLGITDLRRLLALSRDRILILERVQDIALKQLEAKIKELDRLTAVDAEIGPRGSCTVILSGVYRGKAYVTAYELSYNDFAGMVEHFKHSRKEHMLRNIDVPPYLRGSFPVKD